MFVISHDFQQIRVSPFLLQTDTFPNSQEEHIFCIVTNGPN